MNETYKYESPERRDSLSNPRYRVYKFLTKFRLQSEEMKPKCIV